MGLLDFARGPALYFSLAVFSRGTLWHLVGLLRLPRQADVSPPRTGAAAKAWAATTGILTTNRDKHAESLLGRVADHLTIELPCNGGARTSPIGISWPLPVPGIDAVQGDCA